MVRRVPGDQHVLLGDDHAVEGHLGLGGGVDAHAPVAAGEFDPVPVHRHHDRTDPLGPRTAGPPAPHQDPRGPVAERRVVLVAAQAPAARPVSHQRAAHVLDGGAGVGLGDPDAHDGLAVGHQWEPPVLEGGAAQVLDAPGWAVERQLAADGRGHVVAGDLLQDDGRFDVAESEPTPLLADGDPEQVGLGQGLQRRLRQLAAEVGLPGPRRHRPVPDVTGERPQGRRSSVSANGSMPRDVATANRLSARSGRTAAPPGAAPGRPGGVAIVFPR